MAMGTQPPCSILMTLATRKLRSTRRNAAVMPTTCGRDQFQRPRATTANSTEVMAIVPVTAMPYAALSALEFWNARTRIRHPTISALLTSGM